MITELIAFFIKHGWSYIVAEAEALRLVGGR